MGNDALITAKTRRIINECYREVTGEPYADQRSSRYKAISVMVLYVVDRITVPDDCFNVVDGVAYELPENQQLASLVYDHISLKNFTEWDYNIGIRDRVAELNRQATARA